VSGPAPAAGVLPAERRVIVSQAGGGFEYVLVGWRVIGSAVAAGFEHAAAGWRV
jgi:hypothetical protein